MAVPASDRYRALEPLARGSRTTVWRGVDDALGRTVAIKAPATTDPAAVERLHDEVAVHRACSHPSIVALLDAELEAPVPFLVLLPAPGTLGDPDPAPASAAATRTLLCDVLDGLLQLEAVGLVHGRLRPDHALVHWGGRAALCGLGDVRTYDRGAAAAAVLEAGRLAFRALTGAPPTPDAATAARAALARARPDACHEDPVLIGVVGALLQPDPAVRIAAVAARELLLEPLPLLVRGD